MTETHGTSRELYYSANWQVVEERASGLVVVQNVWSPVYVDALLLLRDRDTNSDGTLDERLYAQQDANWNVTALVNTSGVVVERDAFTPYGVVTVLDASWVARSSSAYDWMYLRQGTRRDFTTNFDDSRERIYNVALGRPLQADPLSYGAGDTNLYRWEGNNPTNATDPLGLQVGAQPLPRVPRPPLRLFRPDRDPIGPGVSPIGPRPNSPFPPPSAELPPWSRLDPGLGDLRGALDDYRSAARRAGLSDREIEDRLRRLHGITLGDEAAIIRRAIRDLNRGSDPITIEEPPATLGERYRRMYGPGLQFSPQGETIACPSRNSLLRDPRNSLSCQPCVPPVGTIAYRLDKVPPSRPHYPFPGDHVHVFEMHQSPPDRGCFCFWVEVSVQAPPPPAGAIPIIPAGGGGTV